MKPKRSAKNSNTKPDSALSTIKSFAYILLMVLGFIGLAIDTFKKGGLLKKLIDLLFESTINMLLIPITVGVLWFINRIISSSTQGSAKKSGDLPMFAMMLVGLYYAYRLIKTGSF